MMKTLFITRHYLDQNNGGAIGARAYLDAFASLSCECTLIYPNHKGLNIDNYTPDNVKTVSCDDLRMKWRKGIDIYRGILHRFNDFVDKYLSVNHNFDICVLDHSILGLHLIDIIRKHTNSKIITIHCNVEKQYNKDNPVILPLRIPYTKFIEKAELTALKGSDLNLTVTHEDAECFRSWNLGEDVSNSIEYWGTFEYKKTHPIYTQHSLKYKNFIISGSLNFPQTENAIFDFFNEYYDILKGTVNDCTLTITGRNPSERLRKKILSYASAVRLIPNPGDIYDVIKNGDVYICPVSGGSGVKLRIMDGLKLGLPILCHKNSACGYETIAAGKGLFSYSNQKSFKYSLNNLINPQLDSDYIYQLYKSRFSFEAGKNRLEKILKERNFL